MSIEGVGMACLSLISNRRDLYTSHLYGIINGWISYVRLVRNLSRAEEIVKIFVINP